MMSKHTPGPWSWDGRVLWGVDPQNPDGRWLVLMVHADESGELPDEPDEALIGAAPDLLAAALAALAELDYDKRMAEKNGTVFDTAKRDAMLALRDAVVKATAS